MWQYKKKAWQMLITPLTEKETVVRTGEGQR